MGDMGKMQATEQQRTKYLSFPVSNELYGIPIHVVQEIIDIPHSVSGVPNCPAYVEGVFNLRGHILPLIDLRDRLNLDKYELSDRACVIVVQISNEQREATIALTVDDVPQVINVHDKQIDSSSGVGGVNQDMILGFGKTDAGVVILIDIDNIFHELDVRAEVESLEALEAGVAK